MVIRNQNTVYVDIVRLTIRLKEEVKFGDAARLIKSWLERKIVHFIPTLRSHKAFYRL